MKYKALANPFSEFPLFLTLNPFLLEINSLYEAIPVDTLLVQKNFQEKMPPKLRPEGTHGAPLP